MKPVTGYLTEDQKFFVSENAARAHERLTNAITDLDVREAILKNMCESHNVQPLSFVNYTKAMTAEVRDFLDALEEYEAALHEVDENPPGTTGNPDDDASGGEDFETVVEQPSGGHEPMSDVGNSPQQETVRVQQPGDGPRSGGDIAPSFRRSPYMAAASEAAITTSRQGDGRKDIRSGTLETHTKGR